MKLYLLRHGQPNPEHLDPEKKLSPEGENEIKRLAAFLASRKITVKEIWHSEKPRARQTAQLVAEGIHSQNGVIEKKGINPADRVEPVVGRILAFQADLLIVSHLPFVAHLLSLLLTGDEYRISFDYNTGGIACLEFTNGKWTLHWFTNPHMVGN